MASILRYFSVSLIIGSAVFLSHRLTGQSSKALLEEKERIISIAVGPQRLLLEDDIGSNFSYSGTGATWLIGYRTLDTTRLHTFNLRYTRTNFTNNLSEGAVEGLQLSLRYRYQPKLLQFNLLDANLFVGPYLSFNTFPRSFMLNPYPVTVDSGDLFGSIGLSGSLIKPIKRHSFVQVAMSVPIISYVVSREFTGSTTQEWAFVNQLIDYRFGVTYTHALSEKWVFDTGYHFLFYRANRTNDVTYGGHRLALGLGFRL